MLDSTFHGIYRDIGDAVKNCNTDDYAAIDQIVVDTFHKTEKPYEVPQKLWDDFWKLSGLASKLDLVWMMVTLIR